MSRAKNPIDYEAVMRAVFHEVESRGAARVTMEAVARATGVSVGTLYAQFGNREAVLRSAYWTYSLQVDGLLDARYSEYPEGMPFRDFWRTLVRYFVDDPHGRAFAALFRERKAFLPASEQPRVVPFFLEHWLEQNANLLGPAPLGVQAQIVWGLLFAATSRLVGQRQHGPMSIAGMGNACWAALRARAAPRLTPPR